MPYRPSRWMLAPELGGIKRTKAGDYAEADAPEFDMEIHYYELPSLIAALEEGGFLKPRLDERLRADDLKITHRLLDLLGEAIKT